LPATPKEDQTGASLTLAALDAIDRYWQTSATPLRAVLLCYTVGKSVDGPWEVVEKATERFGPDRVNFDRLTKELTRIDGSNRYLVPATTRQIVQGAKCHPDAPRREQDRFQQGCQNLIEALDREGWGHVGYGTLYLELPAHSSTS
jgi:hypothetical protein